MTETEEACGAGCGYVSSGRDLIGHMLHEHKRCPDCGNAPIAAHDSVTHEPDCPRLRPGYVYPAPVADEDVTFADPHGGTGLDDWEF